jgi:hypothetical protein
MTATGAVVETKESDASEKKEWIFLRPGFKCQRILYYIIYLIFI